MVEDWSLYTNKTKEDILLQEYWINTLYYIIRLKSLLQISFVSERNNS